MRKRNKPLAVVGPIRLFRIEKPEDRKVDFHKAIVLADDYIDFHGRTKMSGGLFFPRSDKWKALKLIVKWYLKK